MGKNYDAYAKAVQAQNETANRMVTVSGGSTEAAYSEALANAQQADAAVQDTWTTLMNDPEG